MKHKCKIKTVSDRDFFFDIIQLNRILDLIIKIQPKINGNKFSRSYRNYDVLLFYSDYGKIRVKIKKKYIYAFFETLPQIIIFIPKNIIPKNKNYRFSNVLNLKMLYFWGNEEPFAIFEYF